MVDLNQPEILQQKQHAHHQDRRAGDDAEGSRMPPVVAAEHVMLAVHPLMNIVPQLVSKFLMIEIVHNGLLSR
jgi:hypothetical protein